MDEIKLGEVTVTRIENPSRLPELPGPENSRKRRSEATDSKPAQAFVLVPGAWLGGWSWQPVARLLTGRGYPVLALNLRGLSYDGSPPGLRLADAVNYIVSEVERRDLADVVLACHSWGGYPASHRLRGRVAKVIYFSVVVPARGRSMASESEQYGEIIRQAIAASPTRPSRSAWTPSRACSCRATPPRSRNSSASYCCRSRAVT